MIILDDREVNIPIVSRVCTFCEYLDTSKGKRICKAFPKGIPMEIWLGKNKHLKPIKGQGNDLVFKKKKK